MSGSAYQPLTNGLPDVAGAHDAAAVASASSVWTGALAGGSGAPPQCDVVSSNRGASASRPHPAGRVEVMARILRRPLPPRKPNQE